MKILMIIVLAVMAPAGARGQSVQSPCYGLDDETCLSNCFCGVCSKPTNESSCTLWIYKEDCESSEGAYTSYHDDERCEDATSVLFIFVIVAVTIALVILAFMCIFLMIRRRRRDTRPAGFDRL